MRIDQEIRPSERVPSLDKPSLRALSYVLRHREHWPDRFEWNYGDCHCCAMGLAWKLWETIEGPATPFMVRSMNMPYGAARQIFAGANVENVYGVKSYRKITPEMVADKIDEYLAQ